MHFHSLRNFYLADERRVHSREHDYGLWWRTADGGPLHRAAWICETGELYLAELGSGEGRVEVLAVISDRAAVDLLLAGWRETCSQPGALDWLRERTAVPAPREETARRPRVARAAATASALVGLLAPVAAVAAVEL